MRCILCSILHVVVARNDCTVVEALLRRLARDGILLPALSLSNFQHQVNTGCRLFLSGETRKPLRIGRFRDSRQKIGRKAESLGKSRGKFGNLCRPRKFLLSLQLYDDPGGLSPLTTVATER